MKENIMALVDALVSERDLPDEGLRALIESEGEDAAYLRARGGEVCESVYGKAVYLRGLVEFTNYCANDCFYCGLRRSNGECERYRLTEEEVLDCAIRGYQLGFRTIVLQGGEDRGFSDESVCSVVRKIKESCPDTAVTLSIGERDADTYQAYFDAGEYARHRAFPAAQIDAFPGFPGGFGRDDAEPACNKPDNSPRSAAPRNHRPRHGIGHRPRRRPARRRECDNAESKPVAGEVEVSFV